MTFFPHGVAQRKKDERVFERVELGSATAPSDVRYRSMHHALYMHSTCVFSRMSTEIEVDYF